MSLYTSVDNVNYVLETTLTFTNAIGSGCPQPIDHFDLDIYGRYLKLVIDTYHNLGAGWQYLNIEFEEY